MHASVKAPAASLKAVRAPLAATSVLFVYVSSRCWRAGLSAAGSWWSARLIALAAATRADRNL